MTLDLSPFSKSDLEKIRGKPDFEPLAAAFKRVENILRKNAADAATAPDPAHFSEAAEHALYTACGDVTARVAACMQAGDLESALSAIATLRDPVDAFFNDVMVMADDAAVRRNRLALLAAISAIFGQIADFSQISA